MWQKESKAKKVNAFRIDLFDKYNVKPLSLKVRCLNESCYHTWIIDARWSDIDPITLICSKCSQIKMLENLR